jgi:hypothetical protein
MPSVGPIVLICACERDRNNGFIDAVRNTWAATWGEMVSYKFLLGHGCENPKADELVLDVPDDYPSLPYKVQSGRRWATENGYDHTFICDVDTYVHVPRLLGSGFESTDYSGYFIHDEHRLCAERNIEFAQGGGGYWISPRAATPIETAAVQWKASDVFVGDVLFKADIPFTHDTRHWPWGYRRANEPQPLEGGNIYPAGVITVHLSNYWQTPKYKTDWMHETHERFMRGEL